MQERQGLLRGELAIALPAMLATYAFPRVIEAFRAVTRGSGSRWRRGAHDRSRRDSPRESWTWGSLHGRGCGRT